MNRFFYTYFSCLQFFLTCNLQPDSTFHTLFEQFTSVLIGSADVTGGMVCVGSTAAGAVKPCPAVITFRTCIYVALAEFFLRFGSSNTIPDIAHEILFVPYKLVTWIQVAPWSHCKIFHTAAASCDTLMDAWPVRQVDHVVIEGQRLAVLLTLKHIFCQVFVLLEQYRQVRLQL